MAVWVRVPRLLPLYFNKNFLARIGDRIGKTLKVDETTLSSLRGQFAWVSVEVDLSKLPNFGSIEGLNALSMKFSMPFASLVACMATNKKRAQAIQRKTTLMMLLLQKNNVPKPGIDVSEESRPKLFLDYSNWMLAKHPVRRRKQIPPSETAHNVQKPRTKTVQPVKESAKKPPNSGSRFDVVAVDEEGTQKETKENHFDSSSSPQESNGQTSATKETTSSMNGKNSQNKDNFSKSSQKFSPRSVKTNGPMRTSNSSQSVVKANGSLLKEPCHLMVLLLVKPRILVIKILEW